MFLKLCGNKTPNEELGNDKGVIRVGKAFQASVPEWPSTSKDKSYSGEDKLLWNPSILPQEVTTRFLESMNCRDASDEERALWLLHQCKYNTKEALLRHKCSIRCETDFDTWSESERNCFLKGIQKFGKNFHSIQKSIRSKSVEDIINFYYIWKVKKMRCRRITGSQKS